MKRQQKKQLLKESVSEILHAGLNALAYYEYVKNSDEATLADYKKLSYEMFNIVSDYYYKDQNARLYHNSSPKLSIHKIKTDFPRQYKRILKEFDSMGFDYFEVNNYLNSGNIFSNLQTKQNDRRVAIGPNSESVENIINKAEEKTKTSLSYLVKEQIFAKQDTILNAENKIAKRDLENYNMPSHFYSLNEVETLANKIASEKAAEKIANKTKQIKNVKESETKLIEEQETNLERKM